MLHLEIKIQVQKSVISCLNSSPLPNLLLWKLRISSSTYYLLPTYLPTSVYTLILAQPGLFIGFRPLSLTTEIVTSSCLYWNITLRKCEWGIFYWFWATIQLHPRCCPPTVIFTDSLLIFRDRWLCYLFTKYNHWIIMPYWTAIVPMNRCIKVSDCGLWEGYGRVSLWYIPHFDKGGGAGILSTMS